MPWNHYETACSTVSDVGSDNHSTFLVVIKTPIFWVLVDLIVDRICRFTGFHYCTTPLMQYLHARALVHQEDFYVPVADEVAMRYAHWRGWPIPEMYNEEESNGEA